MPANVKLQLYKNIHILERATEAFNEVRKDLVKSLGDIRNGGYYIPEFIGDKQDQVNPKFITFTAEMKNVNYDFTVDIQPLSSELFTEDMILEADIEMVFKYLIQ